MMKLQFLPRTLLLAAAALVFAIGVVCQTPAQQSAGATGQEAMPEISDAQLSTFVQIYADSTGIQQEYIARIGATDDVAEAQRLQEQANREMIGVIEQHGMTPDTYNHIVMAIDRDPDLAERVTELIQQHFDE